MIGKYETRSEENAFSSLCTDTPNTLAKRSKLQTGNYPVPGLSPDDSADETIRLLSTRALLQKYSSCNRLFAAGSSSSHDVRWTMLP